MKIIIDHNGVKREINGPFHICGSREDLECLANRIHSENIQTYGWVEVYKKEKITSNTEPLQWVEEPK